jgi:hypothetical protein
LDVDALAFLEIAQRMEDGHRFITWKEEIGLRLWTD